MTEKMTCFVISPIGSEGSPERQLSDAVLRQIVETALLPDKRWKVLRSDSRDFVGGNITEDISRQIREADLCVVDLTGLNRNVLFEFGMRRQTGLPVFLLAEAGTALPFDIKDFRTHFFKLDDPAAVSNAIFALSSYASQVAPRDSDARIGAKSSTPSPATVSGSFHDSNIVISSASGRAAESTVIMSMMSQLNGLLSSTFAWEVAEGKARPIEFRYAFGMYWESWVEPSLSSDDPKSKSRDRWPGHKRAQLTSEEKAALSIDWPGVVYAVTEDGRILVSSRLIQEYAMLVAWIARCLYDNTIGPESVSILWRTVDLAFPKDLKIDPPSNTDVPTGQFWRWVEFFVFGNRGDHRLSKIPQERVAPWIGLYTVITKGSHYIDHKAK